MRSYLLCGLLALSLTALLPGAARADGWYYGYPYRWHPHHRILVVAPPPPPPYIMRPVYYAPAPVVMAPPAVYGGVVIR